MYSRRGGKEYLKSIKRFEKELLSLKLINKKKYYINIIKRYVVALLPNKLRTILYSKVLRKKKIDDCCKKKKAIILSGVKWDTTIQRHHMIAKWLKEMGYEVYFVEGIISSSFEIKKVALRIIKKITKNEHNTINNPRIVKIIKTNFLPPNKIFNLINSFKVDRILKNIPKEYDVAINYLPIYTTYNILTKIKCKKMVYDCVRDFQNWGGYPKNIKIYEKKILGMSSLVMTDSYYLTNKYSGYQFLPTLNEEQYNIFKTKTSPQKIKRIVYFGQIDTHIDTEILKELSTRYELNIIGNSNVRLDFEYNNRGFFSDKVELAKEIIKYDAIIIPYKGNMDGVIPAKFMESLASNMPVFISSFYDSEYLSDMCFVYHSKDELLRKINNYLYDESMQRRISKFVLENLEIYQYEKFKSLI